MSNRNSRRRKRRGIPRGYIYIFVGIVLVVLIAGLGIAITKYTPTREHLELTEYFDYTESNEAAVILRDEYEQPEGDSAQPYAIVDGDMVYLEVGFVKDNLDDGYVYDSSEITLRYATDKEVYSATVGSDEYTVDKNNVSLGHNVIIAQGDTVYIAADYMQLLTDFEYTLYTDPYRVLVEPAGYEKTVTTAKAKTQIRKLNGPKSPIVEDVVKGEQITLVRDTGKWSFVISENGVMGYVRNNKLSKDEEVITTAAKLPERVYSHISIGEDIAMVWHQVTAQSANDEIADTLADTGNIDVISPTWFYLNDNKGGIQSIASSSYVNYCHTNNIQVWALVSNLEDSSVDTTKVLNTTSSRDALVNNLLAQAITYDLDGINIDIEELSASAADGYIEFIKELSIKCEKNDIVLSVDNYVPDGSSECYNRAQQANYADYVVIMGYDEHYAGSSEAGSVASIGWVSQGVADTLEDVPAEQVILGMPLYCRVWEIDAAGQVSSQAYGMGAIQNYITVNNATVSWNEDCGQYYAEFTQGDSRFLIWVEDAASLEEKLKLIDEYSLAGGAFWKLGFDNSATWNAIAKYL